MNCDNCMYYNEALDFCRIYQKKPDDGCEVFKREKKSPQKMSEYQVLFGFHMCTLGECNSCPYRSLSSDADTFACRKMLYEHIKKMIHLHGIDDMEVEPRDKS